MIGAAVVFAGVAAGAGAWHIGWPTWARDMETDSGKPQRFQPPTIALASGALAIFCFVASFAP